MDARFTATDGLVAICSLWGVCVVALCAFVVSDCLRPRNPPPVEEKVYQLFFRSDSSEDIESPS